ncbi:hypothetical protein [Streptomyces sp. TLI_146]|uniref:hypothetical protein n=1 Tax=Streptomyces sp. TLI_146 TaxID=1938858 RepID=UPI000CC9992C|nr:hypothetical protein [Streptomyces sp. TLI_146]PKV88052.1 hypothetical protein BX283_5658 [Streptomyces sp. TLI_146]
MNHHSSPARGTREPEMFAYEMHKVNQAELLREATAQRLARQARVARRARRNADHEAEGRVSHLRDLRDRFAHAA